MHAVRLDQHAIGGHAGAHLDAPHQRLGSALATIATMREKLATSPVSAATYVLAA